MHVYYLHRQLHTRCPLAYCPGTASGRVGRERIPPHPDDSSQNVPHIRVGMVVVRGAGGSKEEVRDLAGAVLHDAPAIGPV